MENFMANLTNGTLNFRSGADYVAVCASRLLADFIRDYHSNLNVSRADYIIFLVILVVKNVIVWYGIHSTIPVFTSLRVLIALTVNSCLFFTGNSALNFIFIWASFAAVFILSSSVMTPFYPGFRFVMSITALLAMPLGFKVPCTVECVVDMFLVIHVIWYFLNTFWGPIESLIEFYFYNLTAAMIILAFEIFFNTKGFIFVTVTISLMAIPLILDAYRERKSIYYVLMIIVYVFCVREQYLIFKNIPDVIPNVPKSIKIDLPVYPQILANEGG